jgi:bla regulator protein blaR1
MEYLIKVSAILILFYTCYKLFLNRETFFESNRYFLFIGLITAFILPLIVIPKYIEVEPIITQNAYVINETNSQAIVADNSISLTTTITYIYVIGVLFFIGRFLLQFSSLVLLYLNSTKQRVASYIYVITRKALSPFSFFNWIVFNPKQFNARELDQIITHEKVHAQQLHSIDILLVELTSILLWFNPFIWLYKKDLRQNLEFIADKNAEAVSNCKKSYQHLLLKTSVPNYQLVLTNNFYNSLIKKRIVMLHKNRSNNRNQLKFLLILPALAVFLMSFNTKEIYINKEATNNTSNTVLDLNELESSIVETNSNITKPNTTKILANNDSQGLNKASKQDIVTYFIENTFTDAQLDEVTTKLRSHGITLKIKGVKRNSDNKITALKIDAKSKNSNANFSIDNDSAIKTVKITYNAKDDSISIGNSDHLLHDKDYGYVHEDGVFTIKKSGKGNNVFVYTNDEKHNGDHEVIEENGKIIIKSGGKVHELKKATNGKNTFIISDDNDGKVLELKGEKGKIYDIIKADTLESDGNHFKLKGNVVIQSENKDGNIFIHSDNHKDGKVIIKSTESTLWSDDKEGEVIIESSGNSLWQNDSDDINAFQTIGKGKNKIFISGDNDQALFIINDKEVNKKEFDKLDTDTIESVNVLKGKVATEKYGDKGKNGVIVVKTKKKKD